jgi:uncharacterized iron-regulated membrane protein
VIFFAGSFSFFRDEIVNWERGHTPQTNNELSVDFNTVLDELEEDYRLYGRDVELRHYFNERRISINLGASKDSMAAEASKSPGFFYLDPIDKSQSSYQESYTLGEFLYRLHFFAQIPYPYGYYLSGLVAFFFLFAVLTGIIVHWNKIVSNFYVFRPLAKLKTLWTDAHTALGVIGFPFQFVYAVTGAFFMLKLLLVAPAVFTLYEGDENELYKDLEYTHPEYAFAGQRLEKVPDINALVARTRERWEGFKIDEVHIFNFGDRGMHVSVGGAMKYESRLNGPGNIIYRVADGEVVHLKDPVMEASYLDGVKNMLLRLHFGDYAGYGLKAVSLLLGLISCFVILSGVMIWLVARDKKHIPEKRRRFNAGVVRYYLAICLSLYPVTALAFILVKLWRPAGMAFLYRTYFISWLLFSIFFILRKDNSITNKYTLLSGSILGILVPLINGLATGNWLWKTYREGNLHVFMVDFIWILLSVTTFLVYLRFFQSFKLWKGWS